MLTIAFRFGILSLRATIHSHGASIGHSVISMVFAVSVNACEKLTLAVPVGHL